LTRERLGSISTGEQASAEDRAPASEKGRRQVVSDGAYRIEVIRTDEELLALEPEWRSLYETSRPRNPFLSFEWTTACRKHLCPNAGLFILLARRARALVGVAALRVDRERGFRVLRFVGDGRSDYQGFLVSPEHPQAERVLVGALEQHRSEWDLAVLRQLNDLHTAVHHAAMPPALRGRGLDATIAPCLSLSGDWKELCRSGPPSVRRGHRAARKFEREGGTVERWTGADAARFIEDAAEVEVRSWKPDRGISRFAAGAPRELLRQALGALGASGEAELWLARMDGKPVAFLLNFLTPTEVWYYQGAYDQEHRKLFPGGVLHYRCIERAHQAGLAVYDLLSGDEPYKRDWTDGERRLHYLALFPAAPRGYLAYSLLLWPRWRLRNWPPARAALETARQVRANPAALPMLIRARIAGWRGSKEQRTPQPDGGDSEASLAQALPGRV
jgi:CelD/BcsL family acetyltransferase involved in cellulose biosynthesis